MRFTMKAAKKKLKIGAFWTSKKCDIVKNTFDKSTTQLNVFILLSLFSPANVYIFGQ